MATPVITILSQDKGKISAISGNDQCIVTFSSTENMDWWEARATKEGVTPAKGVGLIVESGTTLEADSSASVIVDDEELTQGDSDYTVTVYGHSIDGYYSDGTFENTVAKDISNISDGWYYTLLGDGAVRLYCYPSNASIENTYLEIWECNNWVYGNRYLATQQLGWITYQFTKNSSFSELCFDVQGDTRDGGILIDVSSLINGNDYIITVKLDSLSLNEAIISELYILRIM